MLNSLRRMRANVRIGREIDALVTTAERLASTKPHLRSAGRPTQAAIFPADPWALTGSKGDEAMMVGAREELRRQYPGVELTVITATPEATLRAAALEMAALEWWDLPWERLAEEAAAGRWDVAVSIGADVMDGHYNPLTSTRLLLGPYLVAASGGRAMVSGFSFNESPTAALAPVFERVAERVKLNLRDGVSFERFTQFCKAPARLTADVAFLLQPDDAHPLFAPLDAWAGTQRQANRFVLGVNAHPMLVAPDRRPLLIHSLAQAITSLADRLALSVVLVSHDYRGDEGDDVMLSSLHELLQPVLGPHLHYPRDQVAAANLKAIAGRLDAVLTGRMHLAIASLGMGVPIAAMTYQGKFQGLANHFRLPQQLLIDPAQACDPSALGNVLTDLVNNSARYRGDVAKALPGVLSKSRANFG